MFGPQFANKSNALNRIYNWKHCLHKELAKVCFVKVSYSIVVIKYIILLFQLAFYCKKTSDFCRHVQRRHFIIFSNIIFIYLFV